MTTLRDEFRARAPAWLKEVTFYARLRRGMSVDDALSTPINKFKGGAKPLTFRGVQYNSIREFADAFGVSVSAVRVRLSEGLTGDELLYGRSSPKERVGRKVVIDGLSYSSVKNAIANLTPGMSRATFYYRYRGRIQYVS